MRWPVISESCQVSERKSKSSAADLPPALTGLTVLLGGVEESDDGLDDNADVAGSLNGVDRWRGLGDLIPSGGGRRFEGGEPSVLVGIKDSKIVSGK
jgi:hypothetical protein